MILNWKTIVQYSHLGTLKYIFTTLYSTLFKIYQDKSPNEICLNDSIFVGNLIRDEFVKVNQEHQSNSNNKQLESTIQKISKITMKTCGFLAEIYLENKDFENSRLTIEKCFSMWSEKTVEELNSFMTLLKYYLKTNKEDDALNLVNTIVEHEKIDYESTMIILSTTLRYKNYEIGALFGRNLLKISKQYTNKNIFISKEEKQRFTILFLENALNLVKSDDCDSNLAQGIILYLQNSIWEILTFAWLDFEQVSDFSVTLDLIKLVWEICKVGFKKTIYTLAQSLSYYLIQAIQSSKLDFSDMKIHSKLSEEDNLKDWTYKVFINLLQVYIEASFKLRQFEDVKETIDQLQQIYVDNSNILYLRIKFELFAAESSMQHKILALLNQMVELSDFHIGYIVLLLYDTQDLEDSKGKETIAEFMLTYLTLQDTNLSQLSEVIEQHSFWK